MADTKAPTAGIDPNAPPPIVGDSPVELAPGVYVLPDNRVPLVPNIGIIVGERAALVIDCGLGPRSGAIVRAAAERLAPGKPIYLTLTHFHPEHGFGAQAFRDATILYNRLQHEEFNEKAEGYLSQFRGFGSAIEAELSEVELIQPHIVYDRNCDLDLGGRTVQLRSWGAAHSRGDQVAYLPAEGIVFTGDLVENRFFPIFPHFPPYDIDVAPTRWITTLRTLAEWQPKVVVPGHGELGDSALLAETVAFIEHLRSRVQTLAREGAESDAIVSQLIPELEALHPDWDKSEPWRIAMGVQTFLSEETTR